MLLSPVDLGGVVGRLMMTVINGKRRYAVQQVLLTLKAPNGELWWGISRMKEGGGEPGEQNQLLGLAEYIVQLVSLAVLGVATLGFQLRGQNAKKENTRVLGISSFVCLFALNYTIFHSALAITLETLQSSERKLPLMFLCCTVEALMIAADTAVLVQMVKSRSLSQAPQAFSTDMHPNTSLEGDSSPITVTAPAPEPDTPPYIPNLFRATTDPCEICSMDFNSWRSQHLASASESFDDRYETVIDGTSYNGGQAPGHVQVIKVTDATSESSPDKNESVNVFTASGGRGTLFMGPLDEESGSDTNRSSCTNGCPTDEPRLGMSSRNFLPQSAPEAGQEQSKNPSFIESVVSKLWKGICEDEGFRFSIWMKAAGVACAVALTYSCISAICVLQSFAHQVSEHSRVSHSLISEEYYKDHSVSFSSTAEGNIVIGQDLSDRAGFSIVQAMLMEKPKGQGMKEYDGFMIQHSELSTDRNLVLIHSQYLTKFASFFIKLMDGFYYTVIFGYSMSTVIGYWSLYQVFAKQKEMVVKLNREAAASCQGDSCLYNFWERSRPRYRIGGVVYFLGTFVSTAIIQQHLIGISIAAILATATIINDAQWLLNTRNTQILSWIVVLLIVIVLSHLLGNYVLVDGLKLSHPRWFFLYVFTFSLGNFVLGAFHGIYRLVFLLLSTFTAVSRLDVSSFQSTRGLDNGHNTFMSMVLLTHKTQRVVRAPLVINRE